MEFFTHIVSPSTGCLEQEHRGKACSVEPPGCICYRVSHSGLLYKQRFIGASGYFLSIVSEFLNDSRQSVHLAGKVGALVDVVRRALAPRVVFYDRCCLYCTHLSYSALSETYCGLCG